MASPDPLPPFAVGIHRRTVYAAPFTVLLAAFVLVVAVAPALAHVAAFVDRVFVATGSNEVVAIDVATRTVVGRVTVGTGPRQVVVAPDRRTFYVENFSSDDLSIVDAASLTVSATLPIGDGPYGLAITARGEQVLVACYFSKEVVVLDTASRTVTVRVPLPGNPQRIAAHPDGTKVYVSLTTLGQVAVIATSGWTVDYLVPVDRCFGITIPPDGRAVYVNDMLNGQVVVLDPATDALVGTIPLGRTPSNTVSTPDGRFLFISNYGDDTVSVISTANRAVTAVLPAGDGPYELSTSTLGDQIFVGNLLSRDITLIDRSALAVVGAIPVGIYVNGLASDTETPQAIAFLEQTVMAALLALIEDPTTPEPSIPDLLRARSLLDAAIVALRGGDLERTLALMLIALRHLEQAALSGANTEAIEESITRIAGLEVVRAINAYQGFAGTPLPITEAWAQVDLANGLALNGRHPEALEAYLIAYRTARQVMDAGEDETPDHVCLSPKRLGKLRKALRRALARLDRKSSKGETEEIRRLLLRLLDQLAFQSDGHLGVCGQARGGFGHLRSAIAQLQRLTAASSTHRNHEEKDPKAQRAVLAALRLLQE